MKKWTWPLILGALALPGFGQLGQPLDPEDPLGDLGRRMESVSGDFGQKETGSPNQEKQDDIITQLDKLIEQLQKQSGG